MNRRMAGIFRTLSRMPGLRWVGRLRVWWHYRGASRDFTEARLLHLGHSLEKDLLEGVPLAQESLRHLRFLIRRLGEDDSSLTIRWGKRLLLRAQHPDLFQDDQAEVVVAAGHMSVEQAIRRRRSVRHWQDRPVGKEILLEILDVAQWAPSSCNRQPWRFLAVRSEPGRRLLGTLFPGQKFYSRAPLILVAMVDLSAYGDPEKAYAPYLDGAAIIQNLLLVVHARGLGACWLSFHPSAAEGDSLERVSTHFRIPKNYLPISLVAMGYPAKAPPAPARKDVSDIVQFESEDSPSRAP